MPGWSLEYSFNLDTTRRVIWVKVHGIWKAGVAQRYHDDFKLEIEPIIEQPWAKVVDLTNWRTSYPEVTDIVGEHMDWCRHNNCAFSLYILNNPSTFRQLQAMIEAGGTKEVAKVFRTLGEAEQYLKDHWTGKRQNAV